MPQTVRGGCRLNYRVDGNPEADALLFSNSLGTTHELWNPQVEALAAHFRIIRYDTRGHGESGAPPGAYPIAELGRDALAVLDAAGAARAHVCGLSLGGLTAMWLGIHAPDRVAALVLASTAARIGTPTLWQERIAQVAVSGVPSLVDAAMERWFTAGFRTAHPDVVARHRHMLASCPAGGYASCCAAIRDADLRPELGRVTAPTLVIAGTHDPVTPPADAEAIQARIPGARVALLDAAHIANVERAGAFNDLIRTFFHEQGLEHG